MNFLKKTAMKELKKWIEASIDELKSDDRMQGEPATVDINAPLALIQVAIKGRIHALNQVLRKIPELSDEADRD